MCEQERKVGWGGGTKRFRESLDYRPMWQHSSSSCTVLLLHSPIPRPADTCIREGSNLKAIFHIQNRDIAPDYLHHTIMYTTRTMTQSWHFTWLSTPHIHVPLELWHMTFYLRSLRWMGAKWIAVTAAEHSRGGEANLQPSPQCLAPSILLFWLQRYTYIILCTCTFIQLLSSFETRFN